MIVLSICSVILLYGLVQYLDGRKDRATFVFFFFLTSGFHFLSRNWCPVKYTDFAVLYLIAVALANAVKGNYSFFTPQTRIYKVVTLIGLYITLEFVRTLVLNEELFSFSLSNYRSYIPLLSFWLVQELKGSEVRRLLSLIAVITLVSTLLYDLQPALGIKILQHAGISDTRYRNIPYLAYFFLILATVRLDFRNWKSIAILLPFLMAVILTRHRAVMISYVFCVGLYLLMSRKAGKLLQYGMVGLVVFLLAGDAILNRFEDKKKNRSTIDDIMAVINLDYKSAVNNEFENENGTLSFRVLLLIERVDYMLNHPRYAVFGIGTRHEESPRTLRQFDFNLGTINHHTELKGQISSGDLAWVDPLMRFGFFGIALFLYLSWTIIRFLYKNRTISDATMTAFLFYLFLMLTSLKNDHLYGNMQIFFVYLLIEYVRYLMLLRKLKINNLKLKIRNKV